jgi:hypothetical protein
MFEDINAEDKVKSVSRRIEEVKEGGLVAGQVKKN